MREWLTKLIPAQSSIRRLFRGLRRRMAQNEAAGGDWREVFALVRSPLTNDLDIDVGAESLVIDAGGAPVDHLHYLGPWLRARDWEATAVPELRKHAAALARRLVATASRRLARP